ncbi:uncharacterized protein LOC110021367 isoform X2 [Phalaenopsis equestris]|nr:uncharacterized protein LOC110021367 isoform X2 [Phalaenopsis equestris]
MLIWFAGKQQKTLLLSIVSKIVPGQRTAIFQRYPQPDKEYQSFSLIYKDRSLDLICKDKDEAEVWFVGLKALISCRNYLKRLESNGGRLSDCSSSKSIYRQSPLDLPSDPEDRQPVGLAAEKPPVDGFGSVFTDVILYTTHKGSFHFDSVSTSLTSATSADNSNGRCSTSENFRASLSSAVSSSSHGSGQGDFDALGDAFIWGEFIGDGLLGCHIQKGGNLLSSKCNTSLPKALESPVVLDVKKIVCGSKHAALVTRQGEVFTWGEEFGGRLGHAIQADVSQPKLINALSGMNVEFVACGEYHTCAVTSSGDLYTWGDGVYNSGLLGHGSEASHLVPKLLTAQMAALHVSSVSCGPWHTAVVTSLGQLFTFGDGAFGALGHGDRMSTNVPREVEALIGLRTISTACGVWHTAAVVEMESQSADSGSYVSRKLFTWGDADQGRLGHEDKEHRLIPACVASLTEPNICQVACGHDMTVVLAASGRVYTMGSTIYGQLGDRRANGITPTVVEGKLYDSFVEEISCGSHHVAVRTSKSEVYTWGKGENGQLGHGDYVNRDRPTLVEVLKDKQVKSVACGLNFTAVICLHKGVSSVDQSLCFGCHLPFGFRRKRHNCYNCGKVFCKPCTCRKSIRAALAPNMHVPYRVCDICYNKLRKSLESGTHSHVLKQQNASETHISTQLAEETVVSRVSSADSFKGESRQSRQGERLESNHNPMSLIPNECIRRENMQMPNSQNIMIRSPMNICSASIHGTRIVCRPTIPLGGSLISLPPRSISTGLVSAEVTTDELKKTNECLKEEVAQLKLQLEELTQKYQEMESEFEKKSAELKEAMTKKDEENAKCKAAKEIIEFLTAQLEDLTQKYQKMESEFEKKSAELKEAMTKVDEENVKCKAAKEIIEFLTAQLKDVTERTSEQNMNTHSETNVSHASHELKSTTRMKSSSLRGMHVEDSNGHISDSLPSTASGTSEAAEWVEHAEGGVYITVSSSPCGAKILKRIRFSRKWFSEEKAEAWWAQNRQKLQEKYIFPAGEVCDSVVGVVGSPSKKKSNNNGSKGCSSSMKKSNNNGAKG